MCSAAPGGSQLCIAVEPLLGPPAAPFILDPHNATPLSPPATAQLADKRRELVVVQRVPSLAGINIQVAAAAHVLSEEDDSAEQPGSSSGLKGCSDGCDRLLEYRCGRYLYSPALNTFLPIPGVPTDFAGQLHRVATSRSIQGEGTGWAAAGPPVR